jgi:hypothetical protein
VLIRVATTQEYSNVDDMCDTLSIYVILLDKFLLKTCLNGITYKHEFVKWK